MNRLESLDWLRGLLAFFIMIYHLACWEFAEPNASEVLGRIGIYGVAMFFILSGLSMAFVYHAYIKNLRTFFFFLLRRVFRIWPLLWIAVAAVTFGNTIIKKEAIDWQLIFLNLTTLFGFLDPGAYINTGAWSIGNEMVYYSFTPIFLAIYNRSRLNGNLLTSFSIGITIYFGFWVLDDTQSLASQWHLYIHPLNNLAFYCAGVALFYNASRFSIPQPFVIPLMLITIISFTAWPANGDLIATVTGFNRIAFFVITVTFVLSVYKLTVSPHRLITGSLTTFGFATYGIYLLHPIVHSFLKVLNSQLSINPTPWLISIATIVLTLYAATLSYKWVELPLILLCKRLTAANTSNLQRVQW